MRRKLFNLAAAISLVLFLATAGIWLRSEFRWDELQYRTRDSEGAWTLHFLGWERGSFRYWGDYDWQIINGGSLGWKISSRTVDGRSTIAEAWRDVGFYSLGFAVKVRRGEMSADGRPGRIKSFGMLIPHWFVLLLLALLPARWAVLRQRETRMRRLGVCISCGYDLRATPERCPECGAVPVAAK